jgi:hypothetical protein
MLKQHDSLNPFGSKLYDYDDAAALAFAPRGFGVGWSFFSLWLL